MSTRNSIALALLLLGVSSAAGDGISSSVTPQLGGGIGGFNGGISNTTTAVVPPVSCGAGTIDLSTGCTQPMLGGL